MEAEVEEVEDDAFSVGMDDKLASYAQISALSSS